ncbi:MAG: aconitase family protein, partial [Kiritimatiellia bacterium]
HVRPGMVIFGTDSHTCTHGALGAFATGIGNTDAGFVMGTGRLLIKVPHTLRFVLNGTLPPYVTAKDIILRIIGDIGVDGATYCAMEFCGEAIAALSIEERMTICNMAIEAGAKSGIVPPDEKTLAYVRAHSQEQQIDVVEGDPEAPVMATYTYDVSTFVPCVAKPHLPGNYAPASACRQIAVDQVYIGSCTGGKLEDFILAAKILKGRKVAIRTCLVPATCEVMHSLTTMKIDGQTLEQIFVNAQCEPIARPSCGACLGGPIDTYARTTGTEVVVSTTNRNFIGRMGSKDSQIYLAGPCTAAATAIAGHIESPWTILGLDCPEAPRTAAVKCEGHPFNSLAAHSDQPVSNFKVTGKVYVLGDNIDTDLIIPTMFLNLVPTIPEEYKKLGSHALAGLPESYPVFASNSDGTTPYVMIIAGKNFGCGSSREHAPICIGAAGCKAVVAESYARIYFRNSVATGEVFPLETAVPLTAEFKTGDEATLDLATGTVTRMSDGKVFALSAADAVAPVIAAGGIFNYARQNHMAL